MGDEYRMDEGRKRVLAIVAGILVARHLKTPEDLGESRPSPRTECLIASAVQWADRIMTRIDGVFGNSPGNPSHMRATAFLHARFGLGQDPLQTYKKIIDRWFWPDIFD